MSTTLPERTDADTERDLSVRHNGQLAARPHELRAAQRVEAVAARPVAKSLGSLALLHDHLAFYGQVFRRMPAALRYRKEILNIMADVVVGRGALFVGAGLLAVMVFLTLSVGGVVGLEAFNGLKVVGAEVFSALGGVYGNTRFIAPLVAAIALAAQVGAGFTAELGAQRISDEVDALEVMSVDSITYLVATRVWALIFTMAPLYLAGLFASYFGTELIITQFYGQSQGLYDHYFQLFLPPIEILYSFVQAIIYAIVVGLVHCYYGYFATGGPVGVGRAAGRAIRTSIILINVLQLVLALVLYGGSDTARIVGFIGGWW